MKSLLQQIIITSIAFFIVAQFVSGLTVSGGPIIFLAAALCFVLSSAILKPLLSIVAFPFAFLSTIIVVVLANSISLYITALILKSIKVTSFTITNTTFYGLQIPQIDIGPLLSYCIISVIIAVLVRIFSGLFDL